MAAAALSAAASAGPPASWSTLRGSAQHTGAATGGNATLITDGSRRWAFVLPTMSTPGSDAGAVVSTDGATIYLGGGDGQLYAVDAASGAKLWATPLSSDAGPITDTPTVAVNGTILVSNGGPAGLHLVSPAGEHIGSIDVCGRLAGSPTVNANGTVFVATATHTLCAFSLAGKLLWQSKAFFDRVSTPALAPGGGVVVAVATGYVQQLDASDGSLVWSYSVTREVDTPAIAANGNIFVSSSGPMVTALAPSGDLRWHRLLEDPQRASVTFSPVLDEARQQAYVLAVDPTEVAQRATRLYAISMGAGSVQLVYTMAGAAAAPPSLGNDGVLYLASSTSGVVALRLNLTGGSGALQWSYAPAVISTASSSHAVGPDCTVYAVMRATSSSDASAVYAFRAFVLVSATPTPSSSTSPSVSATPSPSSSTSPSVSATPTPSSSASPSVSASPTPSSSTSPSVSATPSLSPSSSTTPSVTPSSSRTPTQSASTVPAGPPGADLSPGAIAGLAVGCAAAGALAAAGGVFVYRRAAAEILSRRGGGGGGGDGNAMGDRLLHDGDSSAGGAVGARAPGFSYAWTGSSARAFMGREGRRAGGGGNTAPFPSAPRSSATGLYPIEEARGGSNSGFDDAPVIRVSTMRG